MIIPHGGEGKWWRAIAGLIRFSVCKTVVIIILNAPSVKLTAWIPTFISNVIDRLSIAWGAQWHIMGYVLLLGVWIFPRCNCAMLILPPSMHPPMTEQGSPTVRMSQAWWSEIWVNKYVGLHKTQSASLCTFSSGGVEGVKGSAGACCCGSRDGVGCRSGHLELLSWIYCVRGGQDQAPPLLLLLLNTRTLLASDTEQTLAAQTNPRHALWRESCSGQRSSVKRGFPVAWPEYWLIFLSGCQGGEGVLHGDRREGSSHLPLPHVATWSEGMRYIRRGKTLGVTTCLTPLLDRVPQRVCFHFPWNKTLDHMFSFNRQLSGERAGVWSVCQMITRVLAFG